MSEKWSDCIASNIEWLHHMTYYQAPVKDQAPYWNQK